MDTELPLVLLVEDNPDDEIMVRRAWGLTALSNRLNDASLRHDPGIDLMRSIQVEVDSAVLDAYGWSDVDLDHGFHDHDGVVRWTLAAEARREILERLLQLNHQRAREEGQDVPEQRGLC